MNTDELKKINLETLSTNRPFPEHLLALIPHGITKYQIDLVSGAATYTDVKGNQCECYVARRFRISPGHPWDVSQVKRAILDIQQGKTKYAEFLAAIAAAGVIHYTVDIAEGSVMYHGEDDGHHHLEPFPDSLRELLSQQTR